MVDYATSLMFGTAVLMFFLFEVGFRLSTPGFIENELMDLMDFIKMGFLLFAFVMGFMVIGLMNLLVNTSGASSDVQNFVGNFFWVWGAIFILTVMGFAFYLLWWIPKKAKENMQRKRAAE